MINLPSDSRKYTPPIYRVVQELNFKFPQIMDMGVYNRRKIAGSSSWSQHSWGNAVDLTSPAVFLNFGPRDVNNVKHMIYLDRVAKWLRLHQKRLGIRVLLWRQRDHWNHIHIDMHPKKLGTPPIITGQPPQEEELKEYLIEVQKSLNDAGFVGADGKPLVVDGLLGVNTITAMNARDAAAIAKTQLDLKVDTVRVVRGVEVVAT